MLWTLTLGAVALAIATESLRAWRRGRRHADTQDWEGWAPIAQVDLRRRGSL